MKKTPNCPHEEKGAVLVTTLIVLTVLAVVAVAFMQSSSMDQLASRSVSGAYQAQLIADAAVGVARGEVARLIQRYPDSATVWQNIGGGQTNEATVLYVRADANNTSTNARPGQSGAEVAFLGYPLVSRTNTNPLTLPVLATNMPFTTANREMVNLNATNSSRSNAFIGQRSMTNPGAPVAAADWIYIGRNPGPTNTTNPPIGRYAYWVEDESFKVNVNTATNGARGTSTNIGPDGVRLDGSWQSSSNAAVRAAAAATVVSDRGTNASFFPTAGSAAVAAGLPDSRSADEFRFLTTAHSAGLDLSRGGFRRFNLNTITNGDKRTALNRVITAITNSNAAPLFGQRFYRTNNNVLGINDTNAVSTNHAAIYLQKIAANIYDYLDSDDQPTIINNDATYTLRTGRPTEPIFAVGGGYDGSNSIAAFGVESFPRLQEWAMHARVWRMSYSNGPDSRSNFGFVHNATNPTANPTRADYEIWLDYYFEFYNPGTRDITVSNAFITLDKLPAFDGGGSGDALANERSITNIPLNATFPAGRVTILSTAPIGEDSFSSSSSGGIITNRADVVYLTVADTNRKFTGFTTNIAVQTYDPVGDNRVPPNPNFNRLFQVSMRTGPQTKGSILIGNDAGILESFVGLPFNAQTNPNVSGMALRIGSGWIRNGLMTIGDGNNDNVRAASLFGNSNDGNARPSATEGDPRALNDQLEFFNFATSNADRDQTRFYVAVTGNSGLPENSTFGSLNTNYVWATNWTDYTPWQPNSNNAPLFVRNSPMLSVGELGHITDPARTLGSSGNIARSRGGGRTFRIGQPELTNANSPWRQAWYTGSQTNASRTWTSWRLADIFTVTTNTNVAIRGLVNPNGALRDNGAALRAALFGLTFLPVTPEGASSLAGRGANVSNVVSNVVARLTNGAASGFGAGTFNPFWERGEISELAVLNSSASGTVAGGAVMSNAFDRGREELVRRSIEMITTRGSVFTVYAVGQSLRVTPNSTNVTGTVTAKSTFEITPQFAIGGTNDAFDLANANAVTRRFLPPTNYTTKVISTSYD